MVTRRLLQSLSRIWSLIMYLCNDINKPSLTESSEDDYCHLVAAYYFIYLTAIIILLSRGMNVIKALANVA